MTSKRFFFKIMKEDLRHKIWMIALSALGSFLMLTVVWLIWQSKQNQAGAQDLAEGMYTRFGRESREFAIRETISFFGEYTVMMGGVLTVIGAVITGLFGFRYVFHKNMVDAYHSLPVKRDTLFAACFLDGFLIWFVPFLVFYLPTVALAAGFVGKLGATAQDLGRLCQAAALTMAVLVIAFFLVYGLVLTAAMLSGNILNTLVSMLILGFGFMSAFGIVYSFFLFYMDRFLDVWDWSPMSYGSPLIAAPILLYWRADLEGGTWAFFGKMAPDIGLAVALCVCAWLLYRRRASELAEQGVKNRTAATLMKIVGGIVAGLCGWMLFTLLTDGEMVAWGIFGLAFAGVLCLGVLNIIFAMDFKAFFTHKRQSAAVLTAALLICFAFQWDWFGYEHYLPGKEKIAEIGVWAGEFSNRHISDTGEDSPVRKMRFQDVDTIYAYLERAAGEEAERDWINVPTRVTLQSGRSYYRRYRVGREDRDLLWPLLSDEEYLKYAFCVTSEMLRDCGEFRLERMDHWETFRTREFASGAFLQIIEAYNQDVLENPESVFLGEGKRLAQLAFEAKYEDGPRTTVRISVYDTMERTVKALEEAGLGEWTAPMDPGEITAIALRLPGSYVESETGEDLIALARKYYGVPGKEEAVQPGEAAQESAWTMDSKEYEDKAVLNITDRTEIEEICALMDYVNPSRSDNLFQEGSVEIYCIDQEGIPISFYLPKGALPEKYILRFGDCS